MDDLVADKRVDADVLLCVRRRGESDVERASVEVRIGEDRTRAGVQEVETTGAEGGAARRKSGRNGDSRGILNVYAAIYQGDRIRELIKW